MFEIAVRVVDARSNIKWVRKHFRTEAARDRWLDSHDFLEVRFAEVETS